LSDMRISFLMQQIKIFFTHRSNVIISCQMRWCIPRITARAQGISASPYQRSDNPPLQLIPLCTDAIPTRD